MRFYVGTYTQRGSQGIYTCTLDQDTGAVTAAGASADQLNPSFLAFSPDGRFLYAANEMDEGAVSAWAVAPGTGALTLLGRQPSRGAHPCHVSVAGPYLLVANYSGGTVTVLPILADGSLGEPVDTVQHSGSSVTDRQQGPHPHSVLAHPAGTWVYVPDLGLDRVVGYRLENGRLVPADGAGAATAAGAGPRHLTFDAAGRRTYLINELDSTVTVWRVDPDTGALTFLQTVGTLPEGHSGTNWPADIHLHPSGRFLYGSNREQDSIAIFRVDAGTGALEFAGHSPSGGRWPRSFAIDPTGRYLLAAHQHGDTIVTFRIDPETGVLEPTGHEVAVPAPVCIKFSSR
jgi:6-phosphogluconolactonase